MNTYNAKRKETACWMWTICNRHWKCYSVVLFLLIRKILNVPQILEQYVKGITSFQDSTIPPGLKSSHLQRTAFVNQRAKVNWLHKNIFLRDNIIKFNLSIWKYSSHTYGMHTKSSVIHIHIQHSIFTLPPAHMLFDKQNGSTDLELELVTFASHVSDLKTKTL